MDELKALLGQHFWPAPWDALAPALARPEATVDDSLRLCCPHVYDQAGSAPECGYQAELRPGEVAKVMAVRLAREKMLLRLRRRSVQSSSQPPTARTSPRPRTWATF